MNMNLYAYTMNNHSFSFSKSLRVLFTDCIVVRILGIFISFGWVSRKGSEYEFK